MCLKFFLDCQVKKLPEKSPELQNVNWIRPGLARASIKTASSWPKLSFLKRLSCLLPRANKCMTYAKKPKEGFCSKYSFGFRCRLCNWLILYRLNSSRINRRDVFSELPRYVRNIMGYHTGKGRMYFRGTDGNSTFSTETGERIELSQALDSVELNTLDTSSVKKIEGSKATTTSPSGTIGSFEGELFKC